MSINIRTDALALRAHSNIDYYYGPWDNPSQALSKVPSEVRKRGLTIGIIEGGEVVEYQWKTEDLTDEGLEVKGVTYKLTIDSNIVTTLDTDKNTITFRIKVNGNGFGVQTSIYLGSLKLITQPTVLNEYQSFVIQAPENPGNYTYDIKVIDTILNNGTETTKEVVWKEVDVKVDPTSSIYNYKVKSLQNLLNASFSFQIYKINTVTVSSVAILYGTNTKTITAVNGVYTVNIGNDLAGLKAGDLIRVRVTGTGLTETFIKPIVQLTAAGVYSNVQGTIPSKVFSGQAFSATLYFEAETEGSYRVAIKDTSNSNTTVYESSLLSYTNNTLTLRLENTSVTNTVHNLAVYIEGVNVNWSYPALTLIPFSNTEQLDALPEDGNKFKRNLDFSTASGTETAQSYILDLNCYIPYTTDSRTLFKFGNDITIDKDNIHFGSIVYPTPLQQNLSIGFMRNIKSSYQDTIYYYDALFINGVLCTKEPLKSASALANFDLNSQTSITDEISVNDGIRLYYNVREAISQDPTRFTLETNYKARNPQSEVANLPIFQITPLTNVLSMSDVRAKGLESQVSNNKVSINGVQYSVINDNNSFKVGIFGNMGEAKYDTDAMITAFCNSYNMARPSGSYDAAIKAISKKVKADVSLIPDTYLTLTRQIVNSKKLLQKYVAVPCSWSFNGKSGYLLAFTQGTSTLEYALPNFTFKFYTDNTFSTKASVSVIPKIARNLGNLLTYSNEVDSNTEYYTEKELVAKADYMESSHLNNTPTAMFYNAITSQQDGYTVKDANDNDVTILQNPVQGKLNAIEGLPIVISINDINYGSFMLNIAKAGDSLGFGSNGISLEGTSNADEEGQSSRFDFAAKDSAVKAYIDGISNIDSVTTANEDFVNFLKEGLEYRYSKQDLEEIGDYSGSESNKDYSEYLRILKMWYWVYKHDTYSREEFEQMFNFDFAALYYIQMMTFGQTDNLGKNMMIDQFESNGQWYVRPYDMDSQAGLENNGFDRLSPVIEIAQQFVLDEDTKDVDEITYLGDEHSQRFPYSSKTSNLWIRFYRNLKSDIEAFYKQLRDLGYSAESVISLCKKEVIDKLGINQFNLDFQNKYLSNESTDPYEQFAYGNRWVRFKDWIEKRFDFCDTYFGYNKYAAGTTGTTREFTIQYSLPQYTNYAYNDASGGVLKTNWGTECTINFQGTTKQTIWFSPKYITDDDQIFQVGFTNISPRVKLNNLTKYRGTWNNLIKVVDLSENQYMQTMSIDSITVASNNATIPTSVVDLSITKSSAIPQLSNYQNLKTIQFSGCSGDIYLENCLNLQRLTISSCSNLNLTLVNCGNSENKVDISISSSTFNQVTLNGTYAKYLGFAPQSTLNIAFTGATSYLDTLNLFQCVISNGELNLSNLVVNNLLLNQISRTKVIVDNAKTYSILGLNNSGITQWGTNSDTDTFDGSKISNLNTVKMVEPSNSNIETIITNLKNGTYTSTLGFNLKGCASLKKVKNLNVTTNATGLFAECTALETVTNSQISAPPNSMFCRCYNITALPKSGSTSTIHLTTEDGTAMFKSCHKLPYSEIEKVLTNSSNVVRKYWNSGTKAYQTSAISGVSYTDACKITNYTQFLGNKGYSASTTINLSYYAFGKNMSYAFAVDDWSADLKETKNINTDSQPGTNVTITFSGKLPKCLENAYLTFSTIKNHKMVVSSDIFDGCVCLTNMRMCFRNQTAFDNNAFTVPVLPNNTNLDMDNAFIGSVLNLTNLKDSSGKVHLPSNIISCGGIFYGSRFSETLEISQIFENCTKLANATNSFRNCSNFTCNSKIQLYTSSTVYTNIAGIFANVSDIQVTYGFKGKWFSDPEASEYTFAGLYTTVMNANDRIGPYCNTNIKFSIEDISNGSPAISITQPSGATSSSKSNYMKSVLEGAILDNSQNSITLTLSITATYINKFCKGLKLLNVDESGFSTKSTIIIGALNTGIQQAAQAFYNTNSFKLQKANEAEPIALPSTLTNTSYMFANSNITKLPTGLNYCSNLVDASYMFYGCTVLNDKIPTINEGVSFFLPISVTNINYMFYGCYLMHGGVPNTFIEKKSDQENNIKSLVGVFGASSILLSNEAFPDTDDWKLNISEMFPNATNVSSLFYYNWSSTYTGYAQPLDIACFENCEQCNNLFNSTILVRLPDGINFNAAKEMKFAFATASDTPNRNISTIVSSGTFGQNLGDITGIFAGYNTSFRNNEIIAARETLLALKDTVQTYLGMLYCYAPSSSDTGSEYMQPSGSSVVTSSHA